MMGNYQTHKEIGSYLDNTIDNKNFENINLHLMTFFVILQKNELKQKK